MQYLLDTCILIDLLRNRKKTIDFVKSLNTASCFVSEITIAELYVGAEKSDREKAFEEVDSLLDFFGIVRIGSAIRMYAKERIRLERAGTRIDDFDLLIGVSAVTEGMTMVTNNRKHFERISGIEILSV